MRYQLTAIAEEDLADIWQYLSQTSRATADKFLDLLFVKFLALARTPTIGVPCDALLEGMRSFAVKKHVIYFCPMEAGVKIMRGLHGARNFEAHLFTSGA